MPSMSLTTAERVAIIARDDGCCTRCGINVSFQPHSLHHRKPRQMGGTTNPLSSDPRNIVLLCGSGVTGCHGEVEGDRTQAYDDGWLLTDYAYLDRPLIALNGTRIHLSADGSRRDEADPDHHLLGSLAAAIDKAVAQRREALAAREGSPS